MVQSQFSLCWDHYKSNICNGFSSLQQNGEFVDMTIAADGHFVKVHQILVALASPYLKDLITSAPCQHPVIYLNNVSHRVLCLLLEYMYTGEAVVPADCLSSFAETAKNLHIRGLESIGSGTALPVKVSGTMPHLENSDLSSTASSKRIIPTPDKTEEMSLPVKATKIYIKPSTTSKSAISTPVRDDMHDYTDMMEDSNTQDSDDGFKMDDTPTRDINISTSADKPTSKLQFTVSIRGSLQVILNRYIYNLHSTQTKSGLRRWRCVDYRNNKCSAYVTTKGNVVLNRANLHNHAFHDKKILSKIEKKAIYSAIEEVECYREKEIEAEREENEKSNKEHEMTMDNDSFMSLEAFGDNIQVNKNSSGLQVKET